jgi:hypothetical protein
MGMNGTALLDVLLMVMFPTAGMFPTVLDDCVLQQ